MSNIKVVGAEIWEALLVELERKESNSARRYRRHNVSLEALSEKNAFCKQRYLESGYKMVDFYSSLDFMADIENDCLYEALKCLKKIELLIIVFRFEQRLQIAEIAHELNRGVSTISERLERIISGFQENWRNEKQAFQYIYSYTLT